MLDWKQDKSMEKSKKNNIDVLLIFFNTKAIFEDSLNYLLFKYLLYNYKGFI